MTTIRLAWGGGGRGGRALDLMDYNQPAILVSYAYWEAFASARNTLQFRDYMVDSGAFTLSKTSNNSWKTRATGRTAKPIKTVTLEGYRDFCLQQMQDPLCTELLTLDSLTDWRVGLRNTEALWKAGVPVIPVYHFREPESLLLDYASAAPKIAIGTAGLMRHMKSKQRWASEVLARVWPKKIHGLAMMGEDLLMALPFHSVDSSSWETGPAAFGVWYSMNAKVRVPQAPRGKDIMLRAEIEWYLALERRLKQRWYKEMALLEETNPQVRTA